ncbi:hypothetical protein Bca52824_033985 [Brassica carinata]|uniref:Uncharacterized protein n=1 Tax=Brassica carinata TaxID=52824 RepID=A0A8X7SJP4_BRACI|nr:hypothetical protein Bca52824_033985 [Brassica carinata]
MFRSTLIEKRLISVSTTGTPLSTIGMGILVKTVVGEWERLAAGIWRFNRDFTRAAHDIEMRESDQQVAIVEQIQEKYKLNNNLQPPVPVLLTYEFPYFRGEDEEYTGPPLAIRTNRDVEDFMTTRIDVASVDLYVTLGSGNIERYLQQKVDDDTVSDGDTNGPDPKTLSFRGLAKRGYFLASACVLKEICTTEELQLVMKASRILAEEVAGDSDSEFNGIASSEGGYDFEQGSSTAVTDGEPDRGDWLSGSDNTIGGRSEGYLEGERGGTFDIDIPCYADVKEVVGSEAVGDGGSPDMG